MPYFSGNAQDRKGNAIGGAAVSVARSDGAPFVLYADSANTIIRDNPQITNAEGFYDGWAAAGEYEVTITHTGLISQTLTVFLPSSGGGGGGAGVLDIVPTASLPVPGPSQDGVVLIEDAGTPQANLIFYALSLLYRIYPVGLQSYDARQFGFINDGVTDNAAAFLAMTAALTGTRRKVYFPGDGLGYAAHGRITIDTFGIFGDDNTKFLMLDKTNRALFMEGDGVSVQKIQIINPPCRIYRCSSVAQPSGANTAVILTLLAADLANPELGAHSFVTGNTVRVQNIVLTAGSFNDITLTVSSVTATTITFNTSSCTINTTAVYPYDRLDGMGLPIYPHISLSRTAVTADMGVVISCNNYLVEDVTIKWAASAGLMHSYSKHGTIRKVNVYQTAADGIDWTGSIEDSDCVDCVVEGSGDDCYALIGYFIGGEIITDVRIRGCKAKNNITKGRGLGFIGCTNVRVTDFHAFNITGAGLLFYADPNLPCYGNRHIIVDGYWLKGCGNASSSVPTGWAATGAYGAIQMTGGALPQVENRDITLLNGLVECSRNSCFVGNQFVQHEINVDELLVDGNIGNAVDALGSFPCKDSTFRNITINHAQSYAMSLTAGGLGLNEYESITIKNPNRGYPRALSSASSNGTSITLTLKPRQSGVFVSSKAISSLTQVIGLATAVVVDTSDLTTGQYLHMMGSSDANWNVYVPITVTGATTFTFAIQSGVPSPAPGGPLVCGQDVIIQGITNHQFTGATLAIRAAEIAADYALNNRAGMNEFWFLNSVTPSPDPPTIGDVLTITPVPIAVSSITHVGTAATATVTSTAKMVSGMYVKIAGATGGDAAIYNIWAGITVLSATTFGYTLASNPAANAAGTLTWSYITTSSVPQCHTPANSEPDAYVCSREGFGGVIDAILVDNSITDRLLFEKFRFSESLWLCQRLFEFSAVTADQITVRDTYSTLAPNLVPGTGQTEFEPRARTAYIQSVDASNAVPPEAIRFGSYLRTIATAPVSDTWPTAALIAREFAGFSYMSRALITCGNLGVSNMTLTTAAGLTLTGSMVVAPNTEVDFVIFFSNVVPGSEACTITRGYGRAIIP